MKVFKSIQADCALLGIGSYKLSRKHELNVRSLIVFSSYVFGTASCGYYLCCVDESFEQYITSYYETTSFLVCVLQFINLFWQMPKLIDFFLSIEDFIQQRKQTPNNFSSPSFVQIKENNLKMQVKIISNQKPPMTKLYNWPNKAIGSFTHFLLKY